MLKRIVSISCYALLFLGIILLLGFSKEESRSQQVNAVRIIISRSGDNNFVDSALVAARVNQLLDSLPKRTFNDISLRPIENSINKMYYVESSQVYRTIDGTIVVRIKPREALARVVNTADESFYIDRTGKLMRASDRYTARVMVITGNLPARYSSTLDLTQQMPIDEMSGSEILLRELFVLANYIDQNPFLKAWIDHIFVTRNGNFELIPKNGAHVIEFGDTTNMAGKFEKLLIFYQNGLTQVGWEKYRRINLKFNNQVVCSK